MVRTRTLLRVLALAAVATPSVALPASAAPGDVWNAGASWKAYPNQANPAPDSYGNSGIWHYRQSQTLVRNPAEFTLIASFDNAFCGTDKAERWWGTAGFGYPFIGRNTSAATLPNTCPSDGDTTEAWEAGPLIIHPSDKKLAVVEWHSPVTGKVDITGTVKDLDPGCVAYGSDGFGWSIDRAPATRASKTNLAFGAVANGGAAQNLHDGTITQSLTGVEVVAGDIVYIAIDAGNVQPTPNMNCDTTGVDFVITQAGTTQPTDPAQPDPTPPPDPAVTIVSPADGAPPFGIRTVGAATFAGTSVPGAGDTTVALEKRGGGAIPLTVANAPDGSWTAKPKQPMTQGVYDLAVSQTNSANKSAQAHRVFAVDLTRPVLTLTSPPFLSVLVFSGEKQPAIVDYAGDLTPAPGDRPDTVAVHLRYWDGNKWAQRSPEEADVEGAHWTAKSASLRAGQYAAWATQDDLAGNHGQSTTPLPNGRTSPVSDFFVVRRVPETEACVRESLEGLAQTTQQIRSAEDIRTFGVDVRYVYVPPSAGTSLFATAAAGTARLNVKVFLRKPGSRRSVLIARGKKRMRRAGLVELTARPTRAAKKVKPHRRNKLIVVQTVTTPNGDTTRVRVTITRKGVAYASASEACGGAPAPAPPTTADQTASGPTGVCVRYDPADTTKTRCVQWSEPCPAALEGKSGYRTYDVETLFGTRRHCATLPPGPVAP